MRFKKKLKISILPLLVLILLPSIYALTITNTTFHSSVSNYTIFVDSITLNNVTVTNLTIEFYNLTSVGSNFTNVNATYDARADFYGLEEGLTVRNINTSTDLFTSTTITQNYQAAFTPGEVLTITSNPPFQQTADNFIAALAIFATFFGVIALILIGKTIFNLFTGRVVNLHHLAKSLTILVASALIVLLGIALITHLRTIA